jgi:hypothetical protein
MSVDEIEEKRKQEKKEWFSSNDVIVGNAT